MAGHAIVTVVFEPELPLLELQVRSIARFVSPSDVDEVVIIDNTQDGRVAGRQAELRAELGAHPLRVLRAGEVATLPAAGGWRRQQLLKMLVSRLVDSERYLVLDAKNHFVAPLERSFLEDERGRARLSAYGFETHPLRPALERTLTHVGLPVASRVHRYTAAVTPFPFETAVVRALIADLGGGSDGAFARRFLDNDLTEFFLYSAWREARGESLDAVWDLTRRPCPVIWPGKAQVADVRAAVATADQPVFGIHRRALERLTPEAAAAFEGFLAERNLFASETDAHAWLRQAQSAVTSERPERRWQTWAGRGIAATRRHLVSIRARSEAPRMPGAARTRAGERS